MSVVSWAMLNARIAYTRLWRWAMQSFAVLAMPMVNSLGASGYPALQSFLSHILDKRNRFFLLSSKRMFFVLLAALTVEMLEEVFWEKKEKYWTVGQWFPWSPRHLFFISQLRRTGSRPFKNTTKCLLVTRQALKMITQACLMRSLSYCYILMSRTIVWFSCK